MEEKNQNQSIDELIAFLDGRMGNGGGAVKPKFEDGKMIAEDVKDNLFTDGLEEDCPTCANIPNIMACRPDGCRDEEEEEY